MKEILFVLAVCLISSIQLSGQEYRTIDGSGNNLVYPEYGVYHSPLVHQTPVAFDDGYASERKENLPNERIVSNLLFNQQEDIFQTESKSDFVWVFGQFIDHDITLVSPGNSEFISIDIPSCDPSFDPACTGQAFIPLFRSKYQDGTGTGPSNPRSYNNEITAFVDGSNIYGSTQARADWLRTFEGGKLKTSEGDLLPFNTIDGNFNSPRDFDAPEMDNMNFNLTKWFVAGDIRANENILLTCMHVLFLREHNRMCDVLAAENPSWDDEKLYQEAKKWVVGMEQSILYNEWLPALGVKVPNYTGYNQQVNPNIKKAFSFSAFRIGHTMLSSKIKVMNDDCESTSLNDLTLKEAFFNPLLLIQSGGIDPFLKGMSAQKMQEMDGKIVDDVRNFLFGEPGQGGMDLAAINIRRAREVGLADFNSIRAAFGLPMYQTFDEICPDNGIANVLSQLYNGEVDKIDPWVGMLIERHEEDAMIGETIRTILINQFMALRNGDRFYFQNDPSFTEEEKTEIASTRLVDILLRNSGIRFMQQNVFDAELNCAHANLALSETELDIKAFPTLVTEDAFKLGIHAVEAGDAHIYIFNPQGQLVTESALNLNLGMNVYEFNASYFDDGQYIIQVVDGAQKSQTRIIRLNNAN